MHARVFGQDLQLAVLFNDALSATNGLYSGTLCTCCHLWPAPLIFRWIIKANVGIPFIGGAYRIKDRMRLYLKDRLHGKDICLTQVL